MIGPLGRVATDAGHIGRAARFVAAAAAGTFPLGDGSPRVSASSAMPDGAMGETVGGGEGGTGTGGRGGGGGGGGGGPRGRPKTTSCDLCASPEDRARLTERWARWAT